MQPPGFVLDMLDREVLTKGMSNIAHVATLDNLGAQFTEHTTEVWCDAFQQLAATNFDGASHFCQYCGSTKHEFADGTERT